MLSFGDVGIANYGNGLFAPDEYKDNPPNGNLLGGGSKSLYF